MNLWPFSQKNDANPSHQLGNSYSGKIELPPGVKLVAPNKSDLPSPQAKPANAMAAPTEKKEDASRTSETSAHSFEDLTHIPATKSDDPSAIQTEFTEKQDLAGFFEENQLKMVSQGALTENNATLSTLNQNVQEENVQPEISDWLKDLTSQTALVSPPPENKFLTEWATTPKPDSPLAQTNLDLDQFFLAPAGSDEMFLPSQDSFEIGAETSVAEALGLSVFENTDAYTPPEDAEALGFEIEGAFLGEAKTEWPQPLNLPDEALTPNGTDSFLAEVGLHTLPETACLDNNFDDDAFDLDSILLGASPAGPMTPTAFPESQPEPFFTENSEQSAPERLARDLELTVSLNSNFEVELHETALYFGDEAEGFKDSDNFESYDFGHYEEPGQSLEPFVLDEDAASVSETIFDNNDDTASNNQLSFGELQLDEIPLEFAGQGADLNDLVTLSLYAEADESSLSEILTTDDPPAPDLAAPEEQEAELQETAPEISEHSPSIQSEPQAPVSQPKPLPPKKIGHPKTTYVASGDKPGSFELDMLLKNSQFLNRSIDHLVNTYFEQYNQEAS